MAATSARTLSEAAAPAKRNTLVPILIIVVGILLAVAAAVYAYFESQRTETVVILARDIPYGQQIGPDDLTTVEMPRYRPNQLAGIQDPSGLIGQYAARDLGTNDLVQASMVMPAPPAEPTYPNGRKLQPNMVPVPFVVSSAGPINDRDRLNILFLTSDAELCKGLEPGTGSDTAMFACRFLTDVTILYIDGGTAYLELTPYQAHAMWALQGAGVQLMAERYGATSDPLAPMTRLDAKDITLEELTAPAPAVTGARMPQASAPASAAPAAAPAPAVPTAAAPAPAAPAEVLPGSTPAPLPGATTTLPGAPPIEDPMTSQP